MISFNLFHLIVDSNKPLLWFCINTLRDCLKNIFPNKDFVNECEIKPNPVVNRSPLRSAPLGIGFILVLVLQQLNWKSLIILLFAGLCRRLKFSTKIDGYALQFHVIKTSHLSTYVGPTTTATIPPSMRSACTHRCILDPVCVSVNIGPPADGKFICELSDSDHTKHPEDLKTQEGFLYIGTEVIKLTSGRYIFRVFLFNFDLTYVSKF